MTNPASNFSNANANLFQQGVEYWVDAAQRSALYMDAIILTSRADSVIARLASCAVAALVANARRKNSTKSVG